MTNELNKQKAFLKWQESAVVLQTDAKQGIDRAQRLLSMRYLRGRGVLKDEVTAFYWMQLTAQKTMPRPSAAWANCTKTDRV